MSVKNVSLTIALAFVLSMGLAACSPEVGSKEWCEEMKKKDKGEWSGNEAADFAKSCLM
jgi:hypothetical protein